MKKLILLTTILLVAGCVDTSQRYNNLKKMYPKSIVEPSTGLLQQQGYEFIVIDSTSLQIIAVSFYPFSETKISSLRNIR